jgi:kynureninase
MITRDACAAQDTSDPLAPLRRQFDLQDADARRLVYLDGNSLGVLPRAVAERVRKVVEREWGAGLIRSWNDAGWITLSQRIGNKIARLVGAGADELIVADSTSINLFKVLSAAAAIATDRSSGRSRIVSESTSFPTDLYIANAVAQVHGLELTLANDDDVTRHLDERVAILLLTHVHYRSGRIHSMREVTKAAHDAGALVVWDLSHSAGAMSIQLAEDAADFAVGCGYKYLNGGPGAPAFVWAHATHIAWMDREGWQSPLPGWLGHADPFGFTPDYQPAPGMLRFLCGTPPILSLAALECGVDTVLEVEGRGGLDALREKSIALTERFVELVESRCAGHDLALASPRNPLERGSHVSFAHPRGGYGIVQALIARGIIGDFRSPDILRFGFAPLYTRFVDVWDAADQLGQVLETGEWRDDRFSVRSIVT